MAELVIQLEETYGEGAISVDDIFADPIVRQIAAKLPGGAAEAAPPKPVATKPVAAKPVAAATRTWHPKKGQVGMPSRRRGPGCIMDAFRML